MFTMLNLLPFIRCEVISAGHYFCNNGACRLTLAFTLENKLRLLTLSRGKYFLSVWSGNMLCVNCERTLF